MVFEDRFIVVEDGERGPGLDVEIVCGSRVVEVMNNRGQKQ